MRMNIIFLALGIAIGILCAQFLRGPVSGDDQPVAGASAEKSGPRNPSLLPSGKGEIASPTLAELLDEESLLKPAVDDAELKAYLERNGYSREAVIAAALLSKDIAYLIDAAERYPDDPHVQLLVLDNDEFPGDKSAWYDRFKEKQPNNMLASLLRGTHLLKRGATEEALEDLRIASGQITYDEFRSQGSLVKEAALIELGRSPLEAKIRSIAFPDSVPRQVNSANRALMKLIDTATSDEEKHELALLGSAIGNQLSQGDASRSQMNRLVGFSMEGRFLRQLPPDMESPAFSQTPAEMIEEVQAEHNKVRKEIESFSDSYLKLDERQMMHYLDRLRAAGEVDAITWARGQLGLE